ncbi:mannosyltransferase [Exidia glandulosa HHB12029]|uniref:GDP-Man:Man(3)GlcNAc(2)-PP-Dol alpha-1,2-mannosyltransferase n=1 Tax=Exidia glandulosa HHB12029 TaxID=1314781 RepID=A0A165E5R1_EXIGL|nr:mannosyltransferase [Exidia glandulosa HHB12029]
MAVRVRGWALNRHKPPETTEPCNAGGGGELVLWTAIKHIQTTEHDVLCIVYTGDVDATKDEIIAKVNSRFNIALDPDLLHFVFLHKRKWVEDTTWPRFTLAGQSIGSMILAWEAMSLLIPDLFIDTMGYAFSFHVVQLLGGIPVSAYVHYPTISSDMLARVASRKKWHTNTDTVASSFVLSFAKLIYYRIFALFYANALRKASFLMVNSSWTKNHVDAILASTETLFGRVVSRFLEPIGPSGPRAETRTVFPPCNTSVMARQELTDRQRLILSVQQFRPEKDHPLQVRALHALLQKRPEWRAGPQKVELVLVGGARNAADSARVDALKALCKELDVEDNVVFVVNAEYLQLLSLLANASVGISTMVDEHFGINVVEYMAAGLIPVVNASGGPLQDIVVPVDGEPTGYHATDAESYAHALEEALTLSPEAELAMRRRARAHAVKKFSVDEFTKGWAASGWRDWRRNVKAERERAKVAVAQKGAHEKKAE